MKITVDYKIHFWDNWTIYWQTIKIDKELMKKYNNHLKYLYKKIENKKNIYHTFNCDDMCISLYTNLLKDWINFMKITWLYEFCKVLNKNKIDSKRILDRNTIIQVL